MNKIMELAQAYATACKTWGDNLVKLGEVADSWVKLQAEVTRMEAELAEAKGDYKILQGHYSLAVLERNALSNNLAALEAQEPIGYAEDGMLNLVKTYGFAHVEITNKNRPTKRALYLAAGAKEKS